MILAYPQVLENQSLHVLSYSKLNNEKASEKGERWITIQFKVCHVAVKAEERKHRKGARLCVCVGWAGKPSGSGGRSHVCIFHMCAEQAASLG